MGLGIVLMLAFAWRLLPMPFSTELERIGQGRAAAVIVHDHNLTYSNELVEQLGSLRRSYEDRMYFLLADAHHPDGRAFMRAEGVEPMTLLVFDDTGRLLYAEHAPHTHRLASILDRALGQ